MSKMLFGGLSSTKKWRFFCAMVAVSSMILLFSICGGDGSKGIKRSRTTKIGNLTWMMENLNIATDNSWCYGNDEANCAKYGRLYTWDAAMKACPSEWRLPDAIDWGDLIETAGEEKVAGEKLKAKPPQWDGTDEFGFAAIPSGVRNTEGRFSELDSMGYWWSATEDDDNDAYRLYMESNRANTNFRDRNKNNGYSVRCVQGTAILIVDVVKWGGTVTPDSTQRYNTGKPIKILAMPDNNYTFVNWTVVFGEATFADSNSASTTVTLNSNAAIVANFALQPDRQFNPDITYSTLIDPRDNQKYRTVVIGDKIWMAENLNYATNTSKCYDDNIANCAVYGRLYTWNDAKNACPVGWSLPTRQDWNNLVRVAGGQGAGIKLKSKIGWGNEDNGSDEFGFSALPSNGLLDSWWSATEERATYWNTNSAWRRSIHSGAVSDVRESSQFMSSNLSVRCIQNVHQ